MSFNTINNKDITPSLNLLTFKYDLRYTEHANYNDNDLNRCVGVDFVPLNDAHIVPALLSVPYNKA